MSERALRECADVLVDGDKGVEDVGGVVEVWKVCQVVTLNVVVWCACASVGGSCGVVCVCCVGVRVAFSVDFQVIDVVVIVKGQGGFDDRTAEMRG